jgi:uncharacterized membrane protein YuzA (DUF378 family)
MFSFDLITQSFGVWTLVTSITYAVLGLIFWKYLKGKKDVTTKRYLGCGITGVLFFDLITGVIATPLMFNMSFEQAFIGQIPFTVLHLITVSFFVLLVTPLLDKHILQNPKLEDSKIKTVFFQKVSG